MNIQIDVYSGAKGPALYINGWRVSGFAPRDSDLERSFDIDIDTFFSSVEEFIPSYVRSEEVTTSFREKLRKAAQKATSGQWLDHNDIQSCTFDVHLAANKNHTIVQWPGFESAVGSKKQRSNNAKYIALANPENILGLLDRIDELERKLHIQEQQP